MAIRARLLSLLLLTCGWALAQQEPRASAKPAARSVQLDVVVSGKGGAPVAGLQQQDFGLLDNGAARPIRSFKAVSAGEEPVQVILLIDGVNTRFTTVAYERSQMEKFLKSDEGRLAHPTTIAVLTDKGVQVNKGFSQDGNTLSATLDETENSLREITRSSGFWGADERLQISLGAMRQLAAYGATLPGRKLVIWISPGWPLLSGPDVQLSGKQQKQIFSDVVTYSTQLREAKVTVYDVNPNGAEESLNRLDYYQVFLKGVSKAEQANLGNLALQVLAVQSGGLTLDSSTDIAAMLKKCVADADTWYEVTFDMAGAEQPNEYHKIEIKVDKPGLTARTQTGYYAQP